MSFKIKYPIKYCVIGLEKFSHYDLSAEGLSEVNEVYAYIVTKCYLISEIKAYKGNGCYDISYEVVPMWDKFSEEDVIPEYDWNNRCINAINIKSIFDDIESAKNHSRQLNREIFEVLLMECPVNRRKEYEKELEYNFEEAYKLEEKHLKPSKSR